MALTELRHTVACIQTGIQQLLHNRIPICFLNSKQIRISLDNLFLSAAAQKLQPIEKSLAAFLQFETSFLMSKGQINIFVHVPLVNNLLLLDLMKFNNAPNQISSSIALQLAPPDSILAVGHNGLHTTLTEQSLSRFNKYGPLYFSDSHPIACSIEQQLSWHNLLPRL